VADVLVVTDAPWVLDDVSAAISGPEVSVRTVSAGVDVLPAVRPDHRDAPTGQRERRRLARAGEAEDERAARKPGC